MWNWRICRLTSINNYFCFVWMVILFFIKLYHWILNYSNYSNVKKQQRARKKYISILIYKKNKIIILFKYIDKKMCIAKKLPSI